MYAVNGMVITQNGDWKGARQIPTFYLDERTQGIGNRDHALAIAVDIMRSANPSLILDVTLFLTVVKL